MLVICIDHFWKKTPDAGNTVASGDRISRPEVLLAFHHLPFYHFPFHHVLLLLFQLKVVNRKSRKTSWKHDIFTLKK